ASIAQDIPWEDRSPLDARTSNQGGCFFGCSKETKNQSLGLTRLPKAWKPGFPGRPLIDMGWWKGHRGPAVPPLRTALQSIIWTDSSSPHVLPQRETRRQVHLFIVRFLIPIFIRAFLYPGDSALGTATWARASVRWTLGLMPKCVWNVAVPCGGALLISFPGRGRWVPGIPGPEYGCVPRAAPSAPQPPKASTPLFLGGSDGVDLLSECQLGDDTAPFSPTRFSRRAAA
ncbi:hypothetical protein JHW43_003323, partial [Diplocarpon mali]